MQILLKQKFDNMILTNLDKFDFLVFIVVKGPSLPDPDLKLKPLCI